MPSSPTDTLSPHERFCLSPEESFLLAALRIPLAASARAHLAGLASAVADWEMLAGLAHTLGVAALAHRNLTTAGIAGLLPESVESQWRAAFTATLAKNTVLLSEAERILASFDAADIACICLKGALLAESVYPHAGTRPMSDIDLLVRGGAVEEAMAQMAHCGYALHPAVAATPSAPDRVYVKDPPGADAEWQVVVDLHDDLLTGRFGNRKVARLRLADVWERAAPAQVGQVPRLALAPEHELIFLCAHMSIHHGHLSLLSLCDVAYYAHARRDKLDWDAVAEAAGHWGVRRAVGWPLRAAADLVEAPIPQSTLSGLGADGRPPRVLRHLVHPRAPLGDPVRLSQDAQLIVRSMFLDRIDDRLRFFAQLVRRAGDGPPGAARGPTSALALPLRAVRAMLELLARR